MINPTLIDTLREHSTLDWFGIHGINHWQRVWEIGSALCARNGADLKVVEAFAFLHDSCRRDDKSDPSHGMRAAKYVAQLKLIHLKLDPVRLKYLQYACAHHESGKITTNITIGTCWDADRLDLGRTNLVPDAEFLSTDAAKQPDFFEWAIQLSKETNSGINTRVSICGVDELEGCSNKGFTHLIRIVNQISLGCKPSWFAGQYLLLEFGDVVSEEDASALRTKAPNIDDINAALTFCKFALLDKNNRILVSCDYGASRSPALAFIIIADVLGPGREKEALEMILSIRPDVVPNSMLVKLGDISLRRNGALVKALRVINSGIDIENFFVEC